MCGRFGHCSRCCCYNTRQLTYSHSRSPAYVQVAVMHAAFEIGARAVSQLRVALVVSNAWHRGVRRGVHGRRGRHERRRGNDDADGNGVLTPDELFPVIEELMRKNPWAVTMEHCVKFAAIFDADGNGAR